MKPRAGVLGNLSSLVGYRGRRLLNDGAWSGVSKVASAANLLLSVPIVLAALGPARFGIWATVVSLAGFGGFLDFGLGNGAMNLVAGARGRGAEHEIATIVSAARRSLLRIAGLIAAVSAAAVLFVPWARLLHVATVSEQELRLCVAVVAVAVIAGIPLNLSTRVLLGMGEGAVAFRWQAVAQAATLGLVTLLASLRAPLPLLVGAAVIGPLFASTSATAALAKRMVASESNTGLRQLEERIRREGQLFFVLQLAAAIAFGLDLALVTRAAGAEAAGGFAVVQRAFSVVSLSLSLLWVPLWPTYRQALAGGHREWVTRTFRRSLIGAFGYALLAAAVVAGSLLAARHQGVAMVQHAGLGLIIGFAAWTIVDAVGGAISTFFNAASIMRYQVIVATVLAAACLFAKVWTIGRFGPTAAPWTAFVVYVSLNLVPTALLGRRLVRDAFRSSHY
jgi:O-antigen/teichoic acid export membrane protein